MTANLSRNPVREKLKQGQPSFGSWLKIDHPACGEIMADAGFDWLMLDVEHAHFTLESLRGVLQALGRSTVTPLVRVEWNDPVRIKLALDTGPAGILIPMVNTGDQARAAIDACLYPPAGSRGVGGLRAQRYGAVGPFWGDYGTYTARTNENMFISIQVEHQQAVDNIADILAVERIDAVFIGRSDLAASHGMPGGDEHPEILAEVDRVIQACREAGVACGVAALDAADALRWVERGCLFVSVSSDAGFMVENAHRNMNRLREWQRENNGRDGGKS